MLFTLEIRDSLSSYAFTASRFLIILFARHVLILRSMASRSSSPSLDRKLNSAARRL